MTAADRLGRTGRLAMVATALILLCLVLAIGWGQGEGRFARADQAIMATLAEIRGTAAGTVLTPLMRAATAAGDSVTRVIIAALVVLMLVVRRRRGEALWLAGAVAGVALLNWSLKQLFARARPELVEHLVNVHSYSFPSGHAANGLALCVALAMLGGRNWGWGVAAAAAASIGFSRVYLGVHWPSDVAAGWLVGTGWILAWSLMRQPRPA